MQRDKALLYTLILLIMEQCVHSSRHGSTATLSYTHFIAHAFFLVHSGN